MSCANCYCWHPRETGVSSINAKVSSRPSMERVWLVIKQNSLPTTFFTSWWPATRQVCFVKSLPMCVFYGFFVCMFNWLNTFTLQSWVWLCLRYLRDPRRTLQYLMLYSYAEYGQLVTITSSLSCIPILLTVESIWWSSFLNARERLRWGLWQKRASSIDLMGGWGSLEE